MRAVVILVALCRIAAAEPPGLTPPVDRPLPSWSLGGDPLLVAFSQYYEVYGAHSAGRHAAIALSIAHWKSSDDPRWNTGIQFVLRVPVYLLHRFEGPFVEPGLIARFEDNTENTHDFEGPELLVGWQHTWDFGLTLAGAFGVAWQAATTLSSSGMSSLDGYVRVGYAF